jgi:hypothetical protein
MSAINAMNKASSSQNSKADIREHKVFADTGVVVKLRRGLELTLRNIGTSPR